MPIFKALCRLLLASLTYCKMLLSVQRVYYGRKCKRRVKTKSINKPRFGPVEKRKLKRKNICCIFVVVLYVVDILKHIQVFEFLFGTERKFNRKKRSILVKEISSWNHTKKIQNVRHLKTLFTIL